MEEKKMFSVFENTTDRNMKKIASLSQLIAVIRNGDDNSELIELARKKNNNQVTSNVEKLVNAVAWNCMYKGSKIKMGIKGFTELMYFRKSGMKENEIRDFKGLLEKHPFVVAIWKSLDGRGIDCLIRCEVVNEESFEEAWHYIDESIGMDFDENVAVANHLACISYDPDIYFNAVAKTYPLKALSVPNSIYSDDLCTMDNLQHGTKVQHDISSIQCDQTAPSNIDRRATNNEGNLIEKKDYDYSDKHIRYRTELQDYIFGDKEYKFFPNGIPFYNLSTYYKVFGDKRESTMHRQASLLLILNPHIESGVLLENLNQINKFQCFPALKENEIEDVFFEQYEKMQAGTLKVNASVRKLVYKTGCKLSVNEKRWLQGSVSGVVKIDKTLKAIDDAINSLMKSGRIILQEDVARLTERCIRTVKSYWPSFKNNVLVYNIRLTENNVLSSKYIPSSSHTSTSSDVAEIECSPKSLCLQSTVSVCADEETSGLNSALIKPQTEITIGNEPTVVKCSNEDKWVVDIETGELFYSVKEAATECCFEVDDLTLYLKQEDNPTCLRFVQ